MIVKMQSSYMRLRLCQRFLPGLIRGRSTDIGRNIACRSLSLSSENAQASSSGVNTSGERPQNESTQRRTLHGVAKQQILPDGPELPTCDFQPNKYEGISYEEAKQVRSESINPALFTYYRNPVMLHQGKMQWLWDVEGKRYLDLFGGIVTVSVGHCHPYVTDALVKQAHNLWHTTNIYMHPAIHQYAKDLRAKLPEHLNVISRVSDFDVDEATVENFIRPDVVSVAEARGSPSKRRLSVSGDVVEVGPCVNTAAFKRRCLQMEGCGASVEVVLWGEAALKDVSCGTAVITALVKDGGRLTSTVSSQIESSSSVVASGVIVGMEDAENGFPIEVVLHNGESLFIDESLFIGDFNFDMKLPVKVEYTVASGGHVKRIAVGKQ